MHRFILTGTPGCGKTSIIRALQARGCCAVEEAATDVIAREQARGDPEPWTHMSFIDRIVALQRERQEDATGDPQFHDRSPICTSALATYLGFPASAALRAEMERIARGRIYRTEVFFIRNLGFCEPTAARRISFADSLRFEAVHEETYRALGYELIEIGPAPLEDRVERIARFAAKFG
jgi:predicted ATPase